MDPISLAIMAINGLGTVLRNPVLGGGSSVKFNQAAELLGILGTLLQEGDEAIEELKVFTETIEEMAEQGRPPNQMEWDVLRTRSKDAHARLQAAKAALLAEEEEPEPEPEPEPTPEPEPEPEPEEPETPATPDPSPAEETLPPEEPVVDPNDPDHPVP